MICREKHPHQSALRANEEEERGIIRMEQKKRKIPERQCLGCNRHAPKAELLRVVRDPDGKVSLDFKGRSPGRGAYICRSVDCLRKARKNRRISNSLKCEIPDEIWDGMEQELTAHVEDAE